MAILAIAVHAALYIFRPLSRGSEGGLYPYRYWVYALYVVWPLTTASLAFINHDAAYVNFGIYCYLPKRPFWSRLALSWVPRYMILCTVFCVYTAIYVFVQIKFKGFDNLDSTVESSTGGRNSIYTNFSHHVTEGDSPSALVPRSAVCSRRASALSATLPSPEPMIEPLARPEPQAVPEWAKIDYVTPTLLADKLRRGSGISASDFAHGAEIDQTISPTGEAAGHSRNTSDSSNTSTTPLTRNVSGVRTAGNSTTADTGVMVQDSGRDHPPNRKEENSRTQLVVTRRAIKRQLRFMFIYPLVYVLMWTIPFISHCFNYDNYWADHPPFTLTILTTVCTGLQAGIDSIVFSWREQPWARPHVQMPQWFDKLFGKFSQRCEPNAQPAATETKPTDSQGASVETSPQTVRRTSRKGTHWWEWEGGKLRKESVWTGADDWNNAASLPPSQRIGDSIDGPRRKVERE